MAKMTLDEALELKRAKQEEQARLDALHEQHVKDYGIYDESEYDALVNLAKEKDIRPTLYDVNMMLGDIITGEEKNRMCGFLLYVCAMEPVMLQGLSSSGKTHIMNVFTSVINENRKYYFDSSSDKGLIDDCNKINDSDYIIMSEFNKINGINTVVEMMKSWGEGAPFRYKRSKKGEYVEEYIVQPKPFCVSVADESRTSSSSNGKDIIPTEIISRCIVLTADSSASQTVKVMNDKAMSYENPFKVLNEDNTKRNAMLKMYINDMPPLDDKKYILPG